MTENRLSIIMTEQINLPTPDPQISLREEFDDWALLYNPDNGRSVGLTPTGVSIWQSLSAGKDLDGIIKALKEEFDPLPDDVLEDIKIFCDQITRAGFAHT